MKKIYALIGLMFVGTAINAQHQKDTSKLIINARTSLGIKFGVTESNLRGDNLDSLSVNGMSSSLQGIHVGIVVNSKTGKHFWLKHELLVNQKGANITRNDKSAGNYNSSLKTWALDLYPISPTLQYKGLQLYAGPYVSALLDASIQKKNSAGELVNDHTIFGSGYNNQSQSKYLQKFDYGFNIGVEYEFSFGLNLGIKYTKGFSEILDNANSITVGKLTDPTRIKIYSEFVNFSVGYSIMRGNK